MRRGRGEGLSVKLVGEQGSRGPTYTRLYTGGRGFAGKGGSPTPVPGMKGVPYEVEDTASIAKDVDELAAKKVDLVKMWVDDHLGKEKKIPLDLTQAIIAHAHKHRLITAAHIFYLDDAKALVNAGLDGLAHSVRDKDIDQALIDSMKKHNSWQMAATLARENSVFIYAKNPAWLNDLFFTKGLNAATLATLKSPEYQNKFMPAHTSPKYEAFLEPPTHTLKKRRNPGW